MISAHALSMLNQYITLMMRSFTQFIKIHLYGNLVFVRANRQYPLDSLHNGPEMQNFCSFCCNNRKHYNDVIMGATVSEITSLTIVYSTVYSGADQRKRQSSASLAFVWGIHRALVNSPHKGPVTRKIFPFDDVIMLKQESVVPWGISGQMLSFGVVAHYN